VVVDDGRVEGVVVGTEEVVGVVVGAVPCVPRVVVVD
jgi:hypothetical protein